MISTESQPTSFQAIGAESEEVEAAGVGGVLDCPEQAPIPRALKIRRKRNIGDSPRGKRMTGQWANQEISNLSLHAQITKVRSVLCLPGAL